MCILRAFYSHSCERQFTLADLGAALPCGFPASNKKSSALHSAPLLTVKDFIIRVAPRITTFYAHLTNNSTLHLHGLVTVIVWEENVRTPPHKAALESHAVSGTYDRPTSAILVPLSSITRVRPYGYSRQLPGFCSGLLSRPAHLAATCTFYLRCEV